jgi:putative FmdB family regulatory protein
MPIFVYRCTCGVTFERLAPRDAEAPECPECGGATRKIPAGPSVGRRAGAGGSGGGDVAPPWQAMRGNPQKQQREVTLRQNLAAKAEGGQAPSTD